MKKLSPAFMVVLIVLCGCVACTTSPNENESGPATTIARIASDGVGTVMRSSSGGSGAPVIVLEERHNSRVGQVQHAITLIRLHDKYGLRSVALEGFLKGSPPIDTDWFSKAVAKKTSEARARVAVRFLKQGEISAAEFVALVYPDVSLLPTESVSTYSAELPKGLGPTAYLDKIARVDPSWAEEKGKPYESDESIMRLTGDEHLKLAREIKQYAQAKSVPITADEQQLMDGYIDFWEKRMASNNMIVDAATGAPDKVQGAPIAANIGAFHTDGICRLLKSADRSYAVVKPLYAAGDPSRGDLTDAMYDRKNQQRPVFADGLSGLVLTEVSGHKKPQPVLQEAFFQAEAELYAQVTNVAEAILAPPDPPGPPNGGNPPPGLAAGDFDGKWIRINLAAIQYLPSKDDRRRAALMPVVFKSTRKTIWVGALWGRGLESGQATVEQILQHALQEIITEGTTPEHAEDGTGRVQMSVNTFAIVGRDKEAVRRSLLSEG